MSDEADETLSEWELDVLRALEKLSDNRVPAISADDWTSLAEEGWTTSASVRSSLGSKSLATRHTLRRLADWAYIDVTNKGQVQFFRLASKGQRALATPSDAEAQATIDSRQWTGLITPIQVNQVLQIVSEIEDICETIVENEPRAQILGLVRALEILLELPSPPRQGVIELVRDPAFANIVQVATLLAAIVAAVRV